MTHPHTPLPVRLALGTSLAAALALIAGQTAGTSLERAAKFPVDHFTCYPAQLTGGKHPQVTIKNQFGSGSVLVGALQSLCAPVNKNGQGVINSKAHLKCYALSHYKGPTQPHRVSISNQFGSTQVMTIVLNPPQALCAPSSKAAAGAPPGPVPTTLDHYLCYAVEASQFQPKTVKLGDQFATSTDTVVAVRSLCVPTSKNGFHVIQPRVHLLCYLLKSGSHGHPVAVSNQFGLLNGGVATRNRLCVPSLKKVLS